MVSFVKPQVQECFLMVFDVIVMVDLRRNLLGNQGPGRISSGRVGCDLYTVKFSGHHLTNSYRLVTGVTTMNTGQDRRPDSDPDNHLDSRVDPLRHHHSQSSETKPRLETQKRVKASMFQSTRVKMLMRSPKMRSPKYCIKMWILKRKVADKDSQAHSRRTESRAEHSQHHSRHRQGSYGSGRATSTAGVDPFELRKRELDAKIENDQNLNGHPRGYDSPTRATRSRGFDQVEAHDVGPPPWLSFKELMDWQRRNGKKISHGCDRLPGGYNRHR